MIFSPLNSWLYTVTDMACFLNYVQVSKSFEEESFPVKSKKFLVFVVLLLAIGLVGSYAQTKKWTRTGVNTFARVQGKIPTAEVMKMLADKYAGDI